ncbi:Plasmid stabilization system protein ParE [Paraburkholderia sartisoli]|uniref:Plasmid stabilization system protein ParE n=1 Tax=Paraburkholderia sartisoli TaxID=83784 RepID=A0A1H4GI05_9BURK|nr:Plasmid stabilization system protein ParE [Paraburkholderia sartisoli]
MACAHWSLAIVPSSHGCASRSRRPTMHWWPIPHGHLAQARCARRLPPDERKEHRERMTTPPVKFAPEALSQLEDIERYIAEAASPALAARYVDGIVAYCESLRIFPRRGTRRDDIRPGLRITHYRRRTIIAFAVRDGQAFIEGVFYGGQNYEGALNPDPGVTMTIAWSQNTDTSSAARDHGEPDRTQMKGAIPCAFPQQPGPPTWRVTPPASPPAPQPARATQPALQATFPRTRHRFPFPGARSPLRTAPCLSAWR